MDNAIVIQQTVIGAIILIGAIVFLLRMFSWAIQATPPEILERYHEQTKTIMDAHQKANDFIQVLLPLALKGAEFAVKQTPGTEDDQALDKLKGYLDDVSVNVEVKKEGA